MLLEDEEPGATQKYTDPRRHGSGLSEVDATNVICILHPISPAAHEAVAATTERNPYHVIPNADLIDDDGDSLFDPDARPQYPTREIALRISSEVKNNDMGFTFGRVPDSCDIVLTNDENHFTISKCHFRIFVNKDGVMMLQDVSSNGTIVDDCHLRWKKEKDTDEHSRMLQTGTFITVLGKDAREIKFLVRVPNRGDHTEAYKDNLARYLSALPGERSRFLLAAEEHPFGMEWDGGPTYNVVGCLGRGTFATVYKLATKKDGQIFAAKELSKVRLRQSNTTDLKFDNEIRIMKDLRHPNIVQYEDYYDHGDWVYIIMECVPGGELSTYMHKQGPMPEPVAQSMTRQILHALAYLHARGITHRDIKPDNILIAGTNPLRVKLSDFGLSKCIANQETFLKTFCGTLLYCAPEIYPGYASYDKHETKRRRRRGQAAPKRYSDRVDMWSFGAVLFHALSHKAPVEVKLKETTDNKEMLMLNKIMTKNVDFASLSALGISEEAIDFISNLLKRNPVLRPSPTACFEHAWIAEVADLVDYMDVDDGTSTYPGHGLATVEETEEEWLTGSQERDYDQMLGPGEGLSTGYRNDAGERMSKRRRVVPKPDATATSSTEVAYPILPQPSTARGELVTDARGDRLFGEITASALRSSGVFAVAPPPPPNLPALQREVERVSIRDFMTFDTDEPPPSTGETSDQPLQYPRALGIPGALPSSAPSLLGAETQIGQLNMATSPDVAHSEVSTPDTGDPVTPESRELTPVTNQEDKSETAKSRPEPASVREEPIFSRYIDIKLPESLAHDTELVKAFNARQAADKARRAQKAQKAQQAQTFKSSKPRSGNGQAEKATEGLEKAIDAHTGMGVGSASSSTQDSEAKISRRIEVPPIESLYPTWTTTPDGFTKPLRRFGKLTTVPGSFAEVTIYINSRMTSWGRGLSCNVRYEDASDRRIPQYPLQITYYAPEIEARIEKGQAWETAPGIHTIVSTETSRGILVNDVKLPKDSEAEGCKYYGKIYTGDIITVCREPEFLKFRVEMYYGDSARTRPDSEKGFQVLKETVYHRREMQRRDSVKASSRGSSVASLSSKSS